MKKVIILSQFVIALALLCKGGYTQESGGGKSLSDCINLALGNYLPLKAQALEIDKAKQKVNQARSYGLPQVRVTGKGEYYFKLPVLIVPGELMGNPGTSIPVEFGTKYNIQTGLEIGQMIYNAEFFSSLALAKRNIGMEELKLEKTKTELIFSVAQLYYTIKVIDKQSELMSSNINYLEKTLSITLEHLKNGLSKKVDVDRVTVSLANLKAEYNNLAAIRAELANQLKTITCSDSISFTTDSTILQIPISVDHLVCDSLSITHIDFKIAEKQYELSGLLVKQAKSKLQPTLSAFGGYSYQAQVNSFGTLSNGKDWMKIPMTGIRVEIPIFSGFEKRASIKQAELERQQASMNSAFAKQNLDSERENIRLKLLSNFNNARMQQQNLNLSQSVRNITAEQYEQGLLPLIELISAETQLNITRSSYFQALLQYRLTELSWYRATNQLKENLLK